MTEGTTTGNELVVYRPNPLDISRHIVQMEKRIEDLNPESRMVCSNGLYAGGFGNIAFDEYGIIGQAYVKFLKPTDEKTDKGLSVKILETLFGSVKIDDTHVIQHEGKIYCQDWSVVLNKELLFWLKGDVRPQEFSTKLKMKISEERGLLVSNEFLYELLSPLFNPLIDAYRTIRKF